MSDGADGEQTPSASESPDRQAPQEPEEVLEHAGEGRAEQRRPRLLPVWILLGAAVASGGAWAVTERLGGGAPPAGEAQVRLVAASAEPWKVRPDDPGGMEIPNQGTLIYETLATADPEEGPERILPPPEQPLNLPQPVADGADEPAAPAAGAAGDESDPGPDPTPLEVASAAPTTSAPASEAAEPVPAEEAPAPESGEPVAALVEEAPSREGGAPIPRPVAKPRPDTPEAALSAAIEEAPLLEPDAPVYWPWPRTRRRGTRKRLPPRRKRRTQRRCPSRPTGRRATRRPRRPHRSRSRPHLRARRPPRRRPSRKRTRRPPATGVTFSSPPPARGARWRTTGRCCVSVTTTCSSASVR